MATTTKIAEPARVGRSGLTVDSLTQPTEYIVLVYPDEARRHTQPYKETQRIPYIENADAAIVALAKAGLPHGTAKQLLFQVEAKRNSAKAADADRWGRPVS